MDQLDQYIKLQIDQKKHNSFKNDVAKVDPLYKNVTNLY